MRRLECAVKRERFGWCSVSVLQSPYSFLKSMLTLLLSKNNTLPRRAFRTEYVFRIFLPSVPAIFGGGLSFSWAIISLMDRSSASAYSKCRLNRFLLPGLLVHADKSSTL